MARLFVFVLVAVAAAVLPVGEGRLPAPASAPAAAQAPVSVLVTTNGDLDVTEPACPHETRCTLRQALLLADADATTEPFVVSFATAAFPSAEPATIALGAALPAVTRDDVAIDATGAGVILDGSALEGTADGLRMEGARAVVRGLRIGGFRGACIRITGAGAAIGGDRTTSAGNRLGNCTHGLRLEGAGAIVRGNAIGFAPVGDTPAPTGAGILVTAADVVIGGESIAESLANEIANASIGVQVGDGAGTAFGGVRIGRNRIGRQGDGMATGVLLLQPSSGTRVTGNTFAGIVHAAIAVVGDSPAGSVTRNTFSGNHFLALGKLAIDLGANGIRDANDPGDADTGPNTFLNHPVIERATQAAISGVTCAGCRVELYEAFHLPGATNEYGTVPLASVVAGPGGAFHLDAPPVVPGEWVIATATDAEGNTSEFGPAARVGAGAIQCGNVTLDVGWNHAGYFGSEGVALGATFPGDPEGHVAAVYALQPGGEYTHWFRDTPAARTLTALEPGAAYWFLADGPVTLPAGFSLTSPLPVQLDAGWNSFVYFGATADVRDAFASILSPAMQVYRWVNPPFGAAGWEAWRTMETPSWARDFSFIQACGVYMVHVPEAVTLDPLQP